MKVLVSGATGFIGSRICHDLHEYGYNVVGLTTNDQIKEKRYPLKLIDWNDTQSIKAACRNCDVIIDLAGLNARNSKKNADLVANMQLALQKQRKWQNLTIITLLGIIMILLINKL